MNVFFVKWDVNTGRILWSGSTQATALSQDDPSIIVTEELVDPKAFRVVAGAIAPLPPRPTGYVEFNYGIGEWVVDSTSAIRDATAKRNDLLQTSDWTDTLSAKNRLGQELYDQWQTYRQALRDITDQPGYPIDIVWPTAPTA